MLHEIVGNQISEWRLNMGKRMVHHKYKHIQWSLLYGIFYLISFVLLENSNVPIHTIHCSLDDKIPFCEYFVIPYLLWFVFIGVTLLYFGVVCKERKEYIRLAASLCFGMTVFLIVSFVYPNGHGLRPELEGNNVFLRLTEFIYRVDTPANILPSLHVFETIACYIAIVKNEDCKKHKGMCILTGILSVLIIASTLFLKQHSVIDGVFAIGLNILSYLMFYVWSEKYEKELSRLLTKKEICTIPNLLSAFRLLLAIVILAVSQRYGVEAKRNVLIGLVIVSAITDVLDGKIARKYNMVSEVGKILDPIADKVTQGVLLLCFIKQYSIVRPIFVLFLCKECFMLIMGTRTVIKTQKNDGSLWFGKINTVVFYSVMIILVFYKNISERFAEALLLVSGICMAVAFGLYALSYRSKIKKAESYHSV